MKKVNIVVLVVIAGVAMTGMTLLFVANLSRNAGRYSTFDKAKQSGAEVHIQGIWVRRNEVKEDPNYFEFYLQDSLDNTALVRYSDPRPGNLDQATTILVKGRYKDDVFLADKMFLKCPSKYEGEELPQEIKGGK